MGGEMNLQVNYGSSFSTDPQYHRMNVQAGWLADVSDSLKLGPVAGIALGFQDQYNSETDTSSGAVFPGFHIGLRFRLDWANNSDSQALRAIHPAVPYFDAGITLNGGDAEDDNFQWGPHLGAGLELFSINGTAGVMVGIDWHLGQPLTGVLGIKGTIPTD